MRQDEKLKNKVRLSYIISTVSIAMVLFLLGSVGYLIAGLINATDRIKERVEVNIMLKNGTTEGQSKVIESRLRDHAGVHDVTFVPKDEAAHRFIAESGDDFTEFIDFNPLPDSYTVHMAADGDVRVLENSALGLEGVGEVVYRRGVAENIGPNIGKFQLVLLVFGVSLLLISIILLNNTIRVSVYSKRHIISTMKLVGAESGFIMRPFVRSSLAQGLWAALLAAALFVLLVQGLGQELPEITLSRSPVAWIVVGMFAAGVFISLIFTTLAVRKFVRMHTDDIHLY